MRPKKCWMRAGDSVLLEDAPEGMRRRERTQWVEDESVSYTHLDVYKRQVHGNPAE